MALYTCIVVTYKIRNACLFCFLFLDGEEIYHKKLNPLIIQDY